MNVGHQPVTAKGLSAGCRGREPGVGAQTWDREHLGGPEVPSGACGEMGAYRARNPGQQPRLGDGEGQRNLYRRWRKGENRRALSSREAEDPLTESSGPDVWKTLGEWPLN